jgi:hypothetical protein
MLNLSVLRETYEIFGSPSKVGLCDSYAFMKNRMAAAKAVEHKGDHFKQPDRKHVSYLPTENYFTQFARS